MSETTVFDDKGNVVMLPQKGAKIDDQRVVEQLAHLYLLALCYDLLRQKLPGADLRADIKTALYRGQLRVVGKLSPAQARRVALRTDRLATKLLEGASLGDDVRHVMLSVCRLVLKLTDEQRIPDPSDAGVLVALAVMDEAQGDGAEDWGYATSLALDTASGKMFDTLLALGYYKRLYPHKAQPGPATVA